MALLGSCLFIIESFIIPDGFRKWFYLRYFIHPLILFVCQIFLWLRQLTKWTSMIVFILVKAGSTVVLCIMRFFKYCGIDLFSSAIASRSEVVEDRDGREESSQNCSESPCSFSHLYTSSRLAFKHSTLYISHIQRCSIKDEETDKKSMICHKESKFEEPAPCPAEEAKPLAASVDCGGLNLFTAEDTQPTLSSAEDARLDKHSSFSKSSMEDWNINESLPLVTGTHTQSTKVNEKNVSLPLASDGEFLAKIKSLATYAIQWKDSDEFYNKYVERMRWFDSLNCQRTFGIRGIHQLGTPFSLENTQQENVFEPYASCQEMSREKHLRSLGARLEMVYVAQSCLSWDALLHQYRKVADVIVKSGFKKLAVHSYVAEAFQNFHVVLERFIEDDRCHGNRIWNYAQGRFSFINLLQVPVIPGFLELGEDADEIELVSATQLLQVIEECVKVFWTFVKTDNKKPWWKTKNTSSSCQLVEDPRDLELLADLTKRLQKKERWLKHIIGKTKCWLKRLMKLNVPEEESKGVEILFARTDTKLVSRVLQMSVVYSSQIQWCLRKMKKLELEQGMVLRGWSGPLFPIS